MPTGYTSAVQDGTITKLKDFVLHCIPALIGEIPSEQDQYYRNRLNETQEWLSDLLNMTPGEIERAAQEDYEKSLNRWLKSEADRQLFHGRYNNMLKMVRNWQPPTQEHDSLRGFMIEQLEKSVEFDCPVIERPIEKSPQEWYSHNIKEASGKIELYALEMIKELDKFEKNSAWMAELHKSLEEK